MVRLKTFDELTADERSDARRSFENGKLLDDSRDRKRTGKGRAGKRSQEKQQLTNLLKAINACGPKTKRLLALNDPAPWREVSDIENGPSFPSTLEKLKTLVTAGLTVTTAERGRPPELRYQYAVLSLVKAWKRRDGTVVIGTHPDAPTAKRIPALLSFLGNSLRNIDPRLRTLSAATTKARSALVALRKTGQL